MNEKDLTTPCHGLPLLVISYTDGIFGDIITEIQCPECKRLWDDTGRFESY